MEVHFKFDCWPSHSWLLILPLQNQHSTVLIIDHLTVDCQPSHFWSLIASLLTVDPPHQNQQCWSLITSLLTIDPLTVDCWSSITSLLTVDPSHVHFVENNEISVPPRHSMRSTGWPLVWFKIITEEPSACLTIDSPNSGRIVRGLLQTVTVYLPSPEVTDIKPGAKLPLHHSRN